MPSTHTPDAPATPAPGPDFSGLWLPLVTPFRQGAVDHDALALLVAHYRPLGLAGFVACGSTGEAAALDEDEQDAVLQTILQHAEGLPVVMGCSGYHLPSVLARARALSRQPLAGLLVPAPYYVRPPQDGLLAWFRAIADASAVPLIVYDIPYRTGATLALPTLLALAAHDNIRAVKDCGGDAFKTHTLIADGRLQVLAGEDPQIFATVAAGGAGAIAASAHLETARFAELIAALRAGDLGRARAAWQPLPALTAALFAQPNPIVIKQRLAESGLIQPDLRPPMAGA
ncbi:MAG: 4-hydroxy-tetrahydrodipicolinate synthase [Paracidovorax wautersii]|uniref:4-hydroxy-tetrahydrodipicolinate synthase n=1 Tax=Paracidovorax wautersii TaxID=1177982 RepID=A0A7V8JNJ3_9BURK|nr:MAG: 4-hydroxy-tetrahydrodipicolinate synthase [Paracidovorax wautersii]